MPNRGAYYIVVCVRPTRYRTSLHEPFRQDTAIVGAGPGLGLSLAKRFGAAGFQVALLARNPDELDQLVAELADLGVSAPPYVADVTDRPGLTTALAQVEADFGTIDVLEYSPVPGVMPVPAAETTSEASSTSSSPESSAAPRRSTPSR